MYYQSSSEIQGEGLRTLHLMNPNLVGYSDSHHSFLIPHDHLRLEGVAQSPRMPYNMWDAGNQPNTPLSLTLSAAAGFDIDIPCDHHQNPVGQSTAGIIPSNGPNTSKYVKAAQELLDEIVNVVQKDINLHHTKDKATISKHYSATGNTTDELTPSQRQDILMKKAKLNTMLDQVTNYYDNNNNNNNFYL